MVIGRVTRAHGLRGEVRVLPFTESQASFDQFNQLYFRIPEGELLHLAVTEVRPHKKYVLLKLKGIHTREAARELLQAEVLIKKEWLPPLEKDEYYWVDLIGLEAFDEEGRTLGRVERIISTRAGDILALKWNNEEVLLPFQTEVVLSVDLQNGRLLVRPPLGLLEM